jgi:hypothetical protein
MGKHFPVMTLVLVVALVENQAKVEIEATAVVPNCNRAASAVADCGCKGCELVCRSRCADL